MTGSKRVCFNDENVAEIVCQIPNREDISPEEQESLYFSKAEYQLSRAEAKAISRESGRVGLNRHLENAFSEKTKEIQEHLNMWTTQGDACRGLERWCNREHGEKRQQDQFTAIMTVLQVQDDMLNERNGKVDADALRKASHKVTRIARHFARMMGKADSHVMASERGDDEESTAISLNQLSLCDVPNKSKHSIDFDDAMSTTSGMTTDSMEIYQTPEMVDKLKGSNHAAPASPSKRRSRFTFGRKRRNKVMQAGIAVP